MARFIARPSFVSFAVSALAALNALGGCAEEAAHAPAHTDRDRDHRPGAINASVVSEPTPDIDEIRTRYTEWMRVTASAYPANAYAAFMCAIPLPDLSPELARQRGPHGGNYVHVFVNDIAVPVFSGDPAKPLPVGSVIVKAKIGELPWGEAHALGVMIKREAGFDPEGGDWEYAYFDGPELELTGRGRIDNCRACHIPQSATAYLFRTYLGARPGATPDGVAPVGGP